MRQLLDDWNRQGGSRLDRDLDSKIDHPGAAVMDAAWPLLADAVLAPFVERLARLVVRDDRAASDGSAYGSG
jgi:hypothetical protein